MCLFQISRHDYDHRRILGESHRESAQYCSPCTGDHLLGVVATLAGLFFVVAVVLMASAPGVLLQPDQEVRTELNRWFLTVAGSVDAIIAAVLLALAHRPRWTLLAVELAGAVIVAGAIILPFQPTFAAILAIGVVPLIAYQYWRDVRMLHMPRVAGTLPAPIARR
jgi:hypothetical protein